MKRVLALLVAALLSTSAHAQVLSGASTPFPQTGTGSWVRNTTPSFTGPVLVGSTLSLSSAGGVAPSFQVQSAASNVPNAMFVRYRGSSIGSDIILGKSRGGTIGTNTVVQSGDTLGTVSFQGTDSINFVEAARIVATVDGTPGSADMPGALAFATTADGASTPTTRMTINNVGIVSTLGGRVIATRVVTAAGAVTVGSSDEIVVVNKTVGAATTVNLPAGVTGQTFVIKDGKGDANTNPITLTPAAGTIDGGATFVINTNYQAITVVYNGTQWNII